MYQGNWTCSGCGGAITELPFQPRSEAGLTCRACFMKSRGGSGGSGNGGQQSAPPPVPDEYAGGAEPDFGEFPEEAGLASEPPPAPDFDGATPVTAGEKPRFAGSWQCAGCGAAITSLPFQPRDASNLKCMDCFKASRG